MPLDLSYQCSPGRASVIRERIARLLARRSTRAILLVLVYVSTYAGLRASRLLVHQNYIYWDALAPRYSSGGGYVEKHNIGRGSPFDEHGHPVDSRLDKAVRVIFYPLVQAETWYWRKRELHTDE